MAGRKVFAPATVLTAADVNNFLMDQAVMVFADSAARGSAIPTPTEGMVTYLEDTNALEVFTGASFVPVASEPDLSGLIPKSTVTTAGDLIIADGASSVTRIGIGADNTVLTSNGTTAVWEASSSGGLSLISTTALSGATTNITAIPGGFKGIKLVIADLQMAIDSGVNLRINGLTTNSYLSVNNTAVKGSFITISNTHEAAADPMSISIEVFNYDQSIQTKIVEISRNFKAPGGNFFAGQLVGPFFETAAITELNIISTLSTFTGGTAILYGVS